MTERRALCVPGEGARDRRRESTFIPDSYRSNLGMIPGMGVGYSHDELRSAAASSRSQSQILRTLGLSPATSNYARLVMQAELAGVTLPPRRKGGGGKGKGALGDVARLRDLAEAEMTLSEILEAIGLAQTAANRFRLAETLSRAGIAVSEPPIEHGSSIDNLARLSGCDPEFLTSKADRGSASGGSSELAAASCLRRAGAEVSLALGNSCRYDLVADFDGHLHRVQVKTARIRRGSVNFKIISMPGRSPDVGQSRRKYLLGEVDAFVAHCPDNGSVYWVPWSEESSKNEVNLRLVKTKNNQKNGVRWAFDHYIGRV